MAIATFCSRILGLVREQVMAASFGASGLTDAFLVAYRIPNLLRDLFAEGAFSAAFVPTFIEANSKDPEKARRLLWSLFILLGAITLMCSGLIFIFAESIINVFAPTFAQDPEKFLYTVTLTKMMSPFLCFVSIAALFMGVLNSLKIFFLPALAPAFFNIIMILSMVLLPGYFISQDIPAIYALGAGVFIGGIVQALVQFPLIIKKGFAPAKPDQIFSPQTKKVVTHLGPGLIGFSATQINLLVNTILASGTLVGAVSWLNYAFRLFQLPVGILSVSIGNSNLVHFSQAWKEGDKEKAKELLTGSYFLSYFVILPAMVALLVFSDEMVNVIFERGKFTAESTLMTAKALKWYAIGLPFYGVYKIFVPTFYAIDKPKYPVYTSIFTILVNVVFCIIMTPIYGFEVLALGTTISMFLNSTIQGYILKSKIGLNWNAFFNLRILKVAAAAVLVFISAIYLKQFVNFSELAFIERCIALATGLGYVAVSYGLLVVLFGERSVVISFIDKIKSRKKKN